MNLSAFEILATGKLSEVAFEEGMPNLETCICVCEKLPHH